MDQDKKRIIVKEIDHWRRSKLLPEHYCDFLLNLYQDNRDEQPGTWKGAATASVRNSGMMSWLYLFGGLAIISYYVLHFTSFPKSMQISGPAALTLSCYIFGVVRQKRKRDGAAFLAFATGSLALLSAGVFFLKDGGASTSVQAAYIAFCSIVWMVTGIAGRMTAFHISGWVVLCMIYGWVLRNNIDEFDWAGLQMSWIPVCVVLLWLGWLLHHRNKQTGAVLLMVGAMIWFVPEIYGLTATGIGQNVLQLSLIGKLVMAGALLFVWRKKWIEWIA